MGVGQTSYVPVVVKPGDIVSGKFRVERVLGAGGMGVVVAATHLQLDQLVALKFLLPDAASNADVAARFAREARAAAKIRSEHVARVYDVGFLDSGLPYMVMEYLEGCDIGQRLEQTGPFAVTVAVDYVLQACEAIAEAHSRSIVHRDLKPANLFLAATPDGSESVKLLDFGISKAMPQAGASAEASVTRTTDVFGSPAYMSPEQLKASRDVDARTDIWSLGAILFELVTGSAPFSGGTIAEIFGGILHKPVPPLRDYRPEAPAGLEAVVARCLAKSPDDRFTDVGELAAALHPFGTAAGQQSIARVARVMRKGAPVAAKTERSSGITPEMPSEPSRGAMPAAPPRMGGSAANSTESSAATIATPAQSAGQLAAATSTAWSESRPRLGGRPRKRLVPIVVLSAVGLAAVAAFGLRSILRSHAGGEAAGIPSAEGTPSVAGNAPTTAPTGAPAIDVAPTTKPNDESAAATAPAPAATAAATGPTHDAADRAPAPARKPAGAAVAPKPANAGKAAATAKPASATDDWGDSRK